MAAKLFIGPAQLWKYRYLCHSPSRVISAWLDSSLPKKCQDRYQDPAHLFCQSGQAGAEFSMTCLCFLSLVGLAITSRANQSLNYKHNVFRLGLHLSITQFKHRPNIRSRPDPSTKTYGPNLAQCGLGPHCSWGPAYEHPYEH